MNIDELRREAAAMQARVIAYEAAERDRENAKLHGKCFVYRNSYSCPETDADYWSMYTRVLRIENGRLIVHRFQTDRDGKIEIELAAPASPSTLGIEINAEEFDAAWTDLINKLLMVSGLTPA